VALGVSGNRTRTGRDDPVGIGIAFQTKHLGTHFRSVLVAKLAILFERSVDDLFEFRRHLRIEPQRRNGGAVKDGVEDGDGAVAPERQLARGHLEEDGAKRKKVAARIDVLSACLFGGHVGDSAKSAAGDREMIEIDSEGGLRVRGGAGFGRADLGETKVEDFGVAPLSDENVGRLDVAMNDALGVRSVKAVGDVDGNGKELFVLQRRARNGVFEGSPIEKFHDDETIAFVLANFEDRADVGMVEGRCRLCLSFESRQGLRVFRHIFR